MYFYTKSDVLVDFWHSLHACRSSNFVFFFCLVRSGWCFVFTSPVPFALRCEECTIRPTTQMSEMLRGKRCEGRKVDDLDMCIASVAR